MGAGQHQPVTGYAHVTWIVYGTCTAIGLTVINPTLHHRLTGHGGDEGAFLVCVISIAVVSSIFFFIHMLWLRRMRLRYRLVVAALFGLFAFLPPYVVILF